MKSSARVLTFLLVMAPSFAQADDAVEKVDTANTKCSKGCPGRVFNGFSVGIDLIYHMTEVKHQDAGSYATVGELLDTAVDPTPGTAFAMHKRYRFDPAVNIGYSYFNKGFYAGLTGEIAFGDKNRRLQGFFVEDTFAKTKTDGIAYGVKAKCGGYIRGVKSVVYAIAGVKCRDITFQYNPGNELGSKAKLKQPSFVVGVGFDRVIRDKWSLTGEYEYSWRNSTDDSVLNYKDGKAVVNVSQRLREHSLRIGVKYHF